jgi:hypothetical protein
VPMIPEATADDLAGQGEILHFRSPGRDQRIGQGAPSGAAKREDPPQSGHLLSTRARAAR